MSNILTPVDAVYVFEDAYKQATGREDVGKIDTSNFVAVAQTLKNANPDILDNFWGQITTTMIRTVIAVRSYTEKFNLTSVSNDIWGGYVRKLTFLYKPGEETQFNKTDINPDNLEDGSSVDMYKIKKCDVIGTYIFGRKTFQDWITIFDTQLAQYFNSPEEWAAFLSGMLTAFDNKQKKKSELWKRLTVVNKAAASINHGNGLNLVKLYNDEYDPVNRSFTKQLLKTKYLPSFASFFTETVKNLSDMLTEMSVEYHQNLEEYEDIDRFTPKPMQKMYIHSRWLNKVETNVFPNLFHEQFVELENSFEKVNYWQSFKKPFEIDIEPNQIDPATGNAVKGNRVKDVEILACLFDQDSLFTSLDYKRSFSTPFNTGGEYRNLYFNWDFLSAQDDTENFITLYMADEEPTPAPGEVTVGPVAQNRKLFDVTASTFQKNDIVVSDTGITGTLKEMVDSNPITDVWGTGYFMGLKFTLPAGCTSCKVGLNPSEGSGLVEIIDDPDKDGVFKVTDKTTQNFRIEAIINGSEVIQEYDLSSLTLEPAN